MPTNLVKTGAATEPTAAQKAAQEILRRMESLSELFIDAHQTPFNLIWNNTNAPAAEVLEALGTRAGEVFDRGADLVAFLLGAHSGRPICQMEPSEYTPPSYTRHSDGRITLV